MSVHDTDTEPQSRHSLLAFVVAVLLSFVAAAGLVVATMGDDAGHVDQMKVELPPPDEG